MTDVRLSMSTWAMLQEARDFFEGSGDSRYERIASMLRHVIQAHRDTGRASPNRAIDRLMTVACMCAAWAGEETLEAGGRYGTVLSAIGDQIIRMEDDLTCLGDKWLALLAEHVGQAGSIEPENSALLCIILTKIAAEALVWAEEIRDARDRGWPFTGPVPAEQWIAASTASGSVGGSGGSAGGGGGAVARPVPPLAPWVLEPLANDRPCDAVGSLESRLTVWLDEMTDRAKLLYRQGQYRASAEVWQQCRRLHRELTAAEVPPLATFSAAAFKGAMAPVHQQIEERQKAWAQSMGRALHEALINGFSVVDMKPGDLLARFDGGSYRIDRDRDREVVIHWQMTEDEYDQLWAALERGTAWSPYLQALKAAGRIPGPADPVTTARLTPDQIIDRFLPDRVSAWIMPPRMCDDPARHRQHIIGEGDGTECPGSKSFPVANLARTAFVLAFLDEDTAYAFSEWWDQAGRDCWGLAPNRKA